MKKLSLILVALLAIACLLPALAETASSLPSPVAIQDKQEVIGTWSLSGAGMMGIFVSAEQVGTSATLVMSESTALLTTDDSSGISSWELLDDGTIQFTDPDGTTLILVMNDDGSLSFELEADGMMVTLYFTKDAA